MVPARVQQRPQAGRQRAYPWRRVTTVDQQPVASIGRVQLDRLRARLMHPPDAMDRPAAAQQADMSHTTDRETSRIPRTHRAGNGLPIRPATGQPVHLPFQTGQIGQPGQSTERRQGSDPCADKPSEPTAIPVQVSARRRRDADVVTRQSRETGIAEQPATYWVGRLQSSDPCSAAAAAIHPSPFCIPDCRPVQAETGKP